MKIRLISYIMAVIMLVSVLLSAVSCDVSMLEDLMQDPMLDADVDGKDEETSKKDKHEKDTVEDTTKDTSNPTEDTTNNSPLDPPADPDQPANPDDPFSGLDFRGEEFMIVSTYQGMQKYYAPGRETKYSDVISSMVHERNNLIGERYNINIINKFVNSPGDVTDLLRASKLVGNTEVDAVLTSSLYSYYIANGYITDFDRLGIDFSTGHWDLDVMESITYKGLHIAAFGDMLSTSTNVIFYNKDIASNYGVDNLYDLVYSGKWTLDTLYDAMNRIGYTDNNGNAIKDAEDSYALSGMFMSFAGSFVFSSDMKLVEKSANGSYSVNENLEKLNNLYLKVKNLFIDCGLSYDTLYDDVSIFNYGYSLFEIASTSTIENYADVDFQVGILPYPKETADQADYASIYTGDYLCVPAHMVIDIDYESMGKAFEIINYYSSGIEENLWTRALSSEDDMEMIHLIRNSLVSELAHVYNDGTLSPLNNLYANGILSNDASIYKINKQDIAVWNAYLNKRFGY